MTYRIIIQPRAEAELEEAYLWVQQQAPRRAARW
jgi:hypothetical protein